MDRTPAPLVEGHAWLPNRMRDGTGSVPRTRLLGRPAPAVRGPEAVRVFYDESHVHRHDAVPAPVLDTLFGQGPPLLPVRPVPRRPDRDGAGLARRVRPGGRDPAARRLRAEARRGTVGRPVRLPARAVPGPATRPDELVPQGGGAPAAGHRCPASASPSASWSPWRCGWRARTARSPRRSCASRCAASPPDPAAASSSPACARPDQASEDAWTARHTATRAGPVG